MTGTANEWDRLRLEQVGGDHYRKMKIQPIEFILANELNFSEGNIVKLISRHKDKGGAQDILKIKQYCDFILESQYQEAACQKP